VALVSPKTRAQALAADVERRITSDGLVDGDHLGNLETWRASTGFARSTVSEAVRLLVDRGAVEIRPGRNGGIFVTGNNLVKLYHTLLTVDGERSAVVDAIVIRDALEPLVATDATRYRTKADIADLNKMIRTLTKSVGNTENFMRAAWKLHERIAEITPNQTLRLMYSSVIATISESSVHVTGDEVETDSEYLHRRSEVHVDLVKAIVDGDLDATADALSRHVE
jgi:GntR family transcriptional repressor for pyruvate dehydrogenase complex